MSTASAPTQTTTAAPLTHAEIRPAAQMRSASWFIRRAAIGMLALTIFVTGGAWLLHASIEPDATHVADSQ